MPCSGFSEFERDVKDPEPAWTSFKWPVCVRCNCVAESFGCSVPRRRDEPARTFATHLTHLDRPTMIDNAHDTEVLEPEPIRQGGLQREVSPWILTRNCT